MHMITNAIRYYERHSEQNGSEDCFHCKSGMVTASITPTNNGETAKLNNEDFKRLVSASNEADLEVNEADLEGSGQQIVTF